MVPYFCAKQERVKKESIWVKLPCLPLDLWNPFLFKMVGDTLGVYVDVDMSYKVTGEISIARILVLLDLHEGLSPKMCLKTMLRDVVQELDYEGVPFRCHRCHSADHFVVQCDQPFRGNFQVEGRKDLSQEGGASKKARESSLDNKPNFSPNFSSPIHSIVDLIPRVVQISGSPRNGSEADGIAQVLSLQTSTYIHNVSTGT